VKLFSTLAVSGALADWILPAYTARTGATVETTFDPTRVLLRHIAAGARPDVLVAIRDELRRPELTGIIDAELTVPLVRTGVGLAVATGAPAPAIDTVEALVRTFIDSRSVAYSRTGASGVYFAHLLDQLGIAAEVTARATIVDKGFTALALLDGRADLAVQQLSELHTISGVDIVGPLPAAIQHYTEFAAAPAPAHPEALQLARFLASGAAGTAYRKYGLEVLTDVPGTSDFE
jgi:molybdate transport system substrate-binding protein